MEEVTEAEEALNPEGLAEDVARAMAAADAETTTRARLTADALNALNSIEEGDHAMPNKMSAPVSTTKVLRITVTKSDP